MSFEQEMATIEESWKNNPIPEDFLTLENNRKMCSVEGIKEQIENLPRGYGIVYAAVVKDNDIEIKQLPVHKQ